MATLNVYKIEVNTRISSMSILFKFLGKIGITLSTQWGHAETDTEADKKAINDAIQFHVSIFCFYLSFCRNFQQTRGKNVYIELKKNENKLIFRPVCSLTLYFPPTVGTQKKSERKCQLAVFQNHEIHLP